MVSLDAEPITWWEETAETAAWLSIVWNARREERRELRDALWPSRVARREQQEIARREARGALRAAKRKADALTPGQRRAVLFHARRGMKTNELATKLGVSRSAVLAVIAEGARR